MKKQLNEIKRMQQLAGVINESQLNRESIPFKQWKPALVSFIQSNLTSDIAELDMLNDVLREIIADNEQELADPNNQDYLSENIKKSNLKDYYDFLQQQEGADELVGEFSELLKHAEGFNSFKEFIKDEASNLDELDPELANEIRNRYL